MRQYYKAHGKHCFLRSFKTKCPSCGADVLYWECVHGCKVFFDYPPYGKLIKHKCKNYSGKKLQNRYPVIIKKPKGLLEESSPSCPSCGKIFKTERDLKNHLINSNHKDELHEEFLKNRIPIERYNLKKLAKKNYDVKARYKPIFGKINIKKRNK
ncbi:MAG: hypothetical protein EU539_06760 [Promethearchaeota archaeon]|nr:MAG: hypothetical protein EU539_06760 [Candidatus Lokiarchaeota archaeon]